MLLCPVGSWRLLLTTGQQADMGCMDTVILYAYGSHGRVGPVVIGNGEDGVFAPGNTDEFKVRTLKCHHAVAMILPLVAEHEDTQFWRKLSSIITA